MRNVSIKPGEDVLCYIKNNFYYDTDSGKVYRVFKNYDKEVFGISNAGYLRAQVLGKSYQLHNICWFLFYGEWPNLVVDHIDLRPVNNRINNLRMATNSIQNLNKRNKSKFGKYIYFYGGKYQVLVDRKYLGRYNSVEEAVKVREGHLNAQ